MKRLSLVLVIGFLAACEREPTGQEGTLRVPLQPANALAPGYVAVDLGAIDGQPEGMNNLGQVVGTDETTTIECGTNDCGWVAQSGVLTHVGTIPGFGGSELGDISETGVAVGTALSGSPTPQTPIKWQSGSLQALGPLPAGFSAAFATAISDNGQYVTGHLRDASSNTFPFRWDAGSGTITQIPLPVESGNGLGVNNSGQVVGLAIGYSPSFFGAFVWDGTTLELIGPTTYADLSWASSVDVQGRGGINNSGQAPLTACDVSCLSYVWQAGTLTALVGSAVPRAINDAGDVIGNDPSFAQAVLWRASDYTSPIGLGNLGGSFVNARDISNPSGGDPYIVGQADNGAFSVPFIWHGGPMLELPLPSGFTRGIAHVVNDLGQAAGQVRSPGEHAVVWSVPTTAQQEIDFLQAAVASVPKGAGLRAKLNDAEALIAKGKVNAACNKLKDFISDVQAGIKTGKWSFADGSSWIAHAQSARALLGCK